MSRQNAQRRLFRRHHIICPMLNGQVKLADVTPIEATY